MRWRLQFWYGLLLTVILAGFGVTAWQFERAALIRSTDAELERRAGGLARILRNPGPPRARPPRGPEGEGPPPAEDPAGNPPRETPPEREDPRWGPLPLPPEPPESDVNAGDPAAPAPAAAGARDPSPRRPASPQVRLPPQEESAYAGDAQGGWYYVVWLGAPPTITRSANAPADVARPPQPGARPTDPGRTTPGLRARGNAREAYLALGAGDLLLVGHVMTSDFAGLRHAAWLLATAAGAILAVALLVGRWLVSRSLRPIAAISAAAARIAEGDLGQRIGARETDGELGQLADVLNTTFARLEAAFAQQARFTADAAHELRTPVTVLLTHTENALAVGCPSEEHAEAFAACQRAARRMRSLIEALLRLSELDSGQRPLRRVRFDLAPRIAEAVELLRPLAATRRIQMHCDLQAAPCLGDPEAIDQVITNLLSNAIQHNHEGGEVRLSAGSTADGAVLTVQDQGPGIPAEQLPHVFERFHRADPSRSRASGGTGLGLAIVKAIVEAHGGAITVESEAGRGARFTVRLPVAPATSTVPEARSPAG